MDFDVVKTFDLQDAAYSSKHGRTSQKLRLNLYTIPPETEELNPVQWWYTEFAYLHKN